MAKSEFSSYISLHFADLLFYYIYICAVIVPTISPLSFTQAALFVADLSPLRGFEEAAIHHADADRVFLKKRKGFVKYALQHGHSLTPAYVFGERSCYHNVQQFARRAIDKTCAKFGEIESN